MPHTLSVEQKNWCGAILLHMTSNIAPGDKIVCNVEQFFMWSMLHICNVELLIIAPDDKFTMYALSQSYLAIPCNVHKPFAIFSNWNINPAKVYLWWWWERSDDEGYKEEELLAEGHRSALHAQNPLPPFFSARNPLKSRAHYLAQKQSPN